MCAYIRCNHPQSISLAKVVSVTIIVDFKSRICPSPTDLGAQDGLGYSFGLGAKLIPISPIKPMIVFRYEIGHDVGRSDIDALINPDSDEKKDATLFSIIAGVDLL